MKRLTVVETRTTMWLAAVAIAAAGCVADMSSEVSVSQLRGVALDGNDGVGLTAQLEFPAMSVEACENVEQDVLDRLRSLKLDTAAAVGCRAKGNMAVAAVDLQVPVLPDDEDWKFSGFSFGVQSFAVNDAIAVAVVADPHSRQLIGIGLLDDLETITGISEMSFTMTLANDSSFTERLVPATGRPLDARVPGEGATTLPPGESLRLRIPDLFTKLADGHGYVLAFVLESLPEAGSSG